MLRLSVVALICSLFALLTKVHCLLFENGTLANNQLKNVGIFISKPEPSFVRLSVVFADGRQTCGGVLVTPLWIFTSASCVNRWVFTQFTLRRFFNGIFELFNTQQQLTRSENCFCKLQRLSDTSASDQNNQNISQVRAKVSHVGFCCADTRTASENWWKLVRRKFSIAKSHADILSI